MFLCVLNHPPDGHAFQQIVVIIIGPLQLTKVSRRYVDIRASKISPVSLNNINSLDRGSDLDHGIFSNWVDQKRRFFKLCMELKSLYNFGKGPSRFYLVCGLTSQSTAMVK